MTTDLYISLAASAVFLGLAGLAAIRGRRGPMAGATAALCVDLFAYNTLEVLGNSSGVLLFEGLESATAALAAPLLYHLTLAFLGRRRDERRTLIAVYAYFGLVALSCLGPSFSAALIGYPGGASWAGLMLLGITPTFLYAGWLLAQHYRATQSLDERARTQLFIGTMVIGVGGVATDLAFITGAGVVPQLAAPAMLLSALLLTAMTVRFRLMQGTVVVLMINAALIGFVGVVLHLLVFDRLGDRTALLGVCTVSITLLLLAAARTVFRSYAETRERTAHLAMLGRLSSQMAHDIRNPLAAIRGAAQYLEEERAQGRSLEASGEFITLILDQTERLERVVQDYRRLGAAEPSPVELAVDELLERVVESASMTDLGKQEGITVRSGARTEVRAFLDPELLETALENLVRNAIEALDTTGGTVTVGGHLEGEHRIVLSVEDDGPGMDARTRERAAEAFFTTRAQGSGLGLAFARRVAEAHGGQLRIESALGAGTSVRLTLPVDARPDAS